VMEAKRKTKQIQPCAPSHDDLWNLMGIFRFAGCMPMHTTQWTLSMHTPHANSSSSLSMAVQLGVKCCGLFGTKHLSALIRICHPCHPMRNHLIQDMLCMNSLFMLAKSLKLISLLVLFPMPQLKPLNMLSCTWRQLSLFSTQWRRDLTQTQLHQ